MTMSYQNGDRIEIEKQGWYQEYGQQMKAANKTGWHPQPDPGEGVILTLKEADELQAKLEAEAAKTNEVEEAAASNPYPAVFAPTSGSYAAMPSSGAAAFVSTAAGNSAASGSSYVSSGAAVPGASGSAYISSGAAVPGVSGSLYISSGSANFPTSAAGAFAGDPKFCHGTAYTTSGSAIYPWQFAGASSGAYPWQFASSGSAAYPWKFATSGSGSNSAAGSGSGVLGYGIHLI